MNKSFLKCFFTAVTCLLVLVSFFPGYSPVNADAPIPIPQGDGAFHFGSEVYYYCSLVNFNNAAIASVGYQDNFGNPPEYQKPYYIIVQIKAIGDACGGMSAGVKVKLPAFTTLVINNDHPVYCYHNGTPADYCPQSLPVDLSGQIILPSDLPDAFWSLGEFENWFFFIPVITARALVEDRVQAQVQVNDDGVVTNLDPFEEFAVSGPPLSFSKVSPLNQATKQSVSPTLRWTQSLNATSYEYCLEKGKTQNCSTGWKSTKGNSSIRVPSLIPSTTYSWTVRAINAYGTQLSDNATWWTFTVSPKPGAFNKTKPANNSINQPNSVTLAWAFSSQAASYEYCLDKTNDNQCSTGWKTVGSLRSKTLSGLSASTTYYWQVRARNPGGLTLANNGTWWSFQVKK